MIWDKLFKALQLMENPRKDRVADVKKYTYKYADLAQVLSIVKPALFQVGLGLLQGVQYFEGIPYLVTSVFDEQEVLELSRRRIHDYSDAQAEGSDLTYTRRYELLTVFGLAAEDDDGASTVNQPALPATLAEAQNALWMAEMAYCERTGQNAKEFHKQTMSRPDYRNDIQTLHRIAQEFR